VRITGFSRRSAAVLALAAVALLSGLTATARAASPGLPADLLTRGKLVSTTFSFTPLGGATSPQAGRAHSDRHPGLAALRQEDRDATASYESSYPAPPVHPDAGWSPPPFGYDYVNSVDECEQHSGAAGSDDGYIKNHYAFCRIMYGERVDNLCVRGQCFQLKSTFHVNILGFGSERDRKVQFVTFVNHISSTSPALLAGTVLRLDLKCTPLVQADDCIPDTTNSQTSVTKSLLAWQRVPSFATVLNSVAPPAGDPANPDRLGYLDFWSTATAWVPELPGSKPGSKDSPTQKVRFDTQNYLNLNGNNGAIFSRVKAVIHFPVNRPEWAAMAQSAAHYKFAMEHPDQTIPQVVGKQIPGAVDGLPLTRWYYNNTGANRAAAVQACINEWGPDYSQGGTLQCDEYPFNSTQEGAARPGGNFSVQLISGPDNEAAGTWLGAWYSYDRILDGDAFHVDVTL
jgi:hypothetical protein